MVYNLGVSRIPFLAVGLSCLLALAGCGAKGGGSDAKPEAFLGSWSFQDQPTANNPVREATVNITSAGANLDVQGNLSTALVDFTIAGLGEVKEGKLAVDLACTSEGETWPANGGTFSLTPEGKLEARFPSKGGPMLIFDLMKK